MGSVFATSFVPERAAFDASFATLLADDDALLLVAEAGDVSSAEVEAWSDHASTSG